VLVVSHAAPVLAVARSIVGRAVVLVRHQPLHRLRAVGPARVHAVRHRLHPGLHPRHLHPLPAKKRALGQKLHKWPPRPPKSSTRRGGHSLHALHHARHALYRRSHRTHGIRVKNLCLRHLAPIAPDLVSIVVVVAARANPVARTHVGRPPAAARPSGHRHPGYRRTLMQFANRITQRKR
jgi:hypothetical protein